MYLTQQTDYAFRVLIYLAVNPERLVKISSIAQRYKISKSHLMKVVTALVKGGFLHGIRGKGGGLRLAKTPEDITIGAVVRHMESLCLVDCLCFDSKRAGDCIIIRECRLKDIIDQSTDVMLEYLDRHTLADLIEYPSSFDLLREQQPTDLKRNTD